MATSIFVVGPFAGPSLGPLVGGYIAQAGVRWSVLFWVLFAFSTFCLLLNFFTIPYVPSRSNDPLLQKASSSGR